MSQQLLQHMSSYPLTIGLLALATFCSTFGSSLYLQRVHGWDQTSAFLAGSPGALSQITILAAEKGADVAAIAVVQTMRVIILTAALPLVLALTGVTHAAPPPLPTSVASPLGLTALVAGVDRPSRCCCAGSNSRRAGCSARCSPPACCTAPVWSMAACRPGSAMSRWSASAP